MQPAGAVSEPLTPGNKTSAPAHEPLPELLCTLRALAPSHLTITRPRAWGARATGPCPPPADQQPYAPTSARSTAVGLCLQGDAAGMGTALGRAPLPLPGRAEEEEMGSRVHTSSALSQPSPTPSHPAHHTPAQTHTHTHHRRRAPGQTHNTQRRKEQKGIKKKKKRQKSSKRMTLFPASPQSIPDTSG